ncbi:hypothetical protein KDA23_07405 [Candidatus Saccharibacteria bacterium]|nr:hypothetical protein [Candidatus Saccharibacteria bacterium]
MKLMIWLGITIGGLIGSWIGAWPDHGNYLGGWSLLGGAIGSFVGLWAGYQLGKRISG